MKRVATVFSQNIVLFCTKPCFPLDINPQRAYFKGMR